MVKMGKFNNSGEKSQTLANKRCNCLIYKPIYNHTGVEELS